ncbi:MAG: DUF2288 domain-containing protein [Gammaproteobacteria bacterium]|nr:DUF2288 domain-containing protein [Gammaproteobacteria bacterium]
MGQSDDDSPELDQHTKLNLETGILAWSELVRFFARGVVIKVEPGVDLVEAAQCLANDDVALLQEWIDAKKVARATDDDARDWTKREPEFWSIVAAPWVLVQENDPTINAAPESVTLH